MRIFSASWDNMEKKQQAYVKLETEEAIIAKRDVLFLQMELLQILSKIGTYKKLRKQEIHDRVELKKRLREIKMTMGGLLELIPEVEKPKIRFRRKSSEGREVREVKRKEKEATLKKNVDEQLAEIKARLQKLDQS